MIQIGKYNTLVALKYIGAGMLLKDRDSDDVALLPAREVPRDMQSGAIAEAFIFQDNQGRFVATLERARIQLNQFGYLRVREVTDIGAFLDWGIGKDLLVPFAEQASRMEVGRSYLVYLRLDKVNGRLLASSKIHKYLKKEGIKLEIDQEVELLISNRTEIGYKVIIDHQYSGMVYNSDIFRPIRSGQTMKGYVKLVRPDGKIDVVLQAPGQAGIEPNAAKILEIMEKRGGFLPLTDKSSPEAIQKELGMSKKTFKRSVGMLYKQRKIRIDKLGLFLTES